MKVIFLDVDGVMNSETWYRKRADNVDMKDVSANYPLYEYDPEAVKQLNRITDTTGAKIVFSATCRLGRTVEQLRSLCDLVGITGEVVGKTIHMGGVEGYTIPRGCEIEQWLQSKGFMRINWSREAMRDRLEKSEVKSYVILDDDSDMLYGQRDNFIRVPGFTGLTKEIADLAIEILTKDVVDLYYPQSKQ